ncbi:MAG: hypothetical protein BMS9Abin26_1904 [Gammaproteobacteria bacterium]|nr:MAG: hypothetical protein BMS9Abin26_1904 [Gammaproteobacteria bacterium]
MDFNIHILMDEHNHKLRDMKTEDSNINNTQYVGGSIGESLAYGAGLLAVVVGPVLIPGVTIKGWIVGLFGSVMVFFFIVCLLGAWKSIKRSYQLRK